MATKISDLTSVSSLDGSELIEVVQSGGSKKCTVNDLDRASDITSQCTVSANVVSCAVYKTNNLVIVSGTTAKNINGTNVTMVTLPSGYSSKIAVSSYAGAYGGTFVGEVSIAKNSNIIKANISASTNNGVFEIVIPV